jgi:hypothetical protein
VPLRADPRAEHPSRCPPGTAEQNASATCPPAADSFSQLLAASPFHFPGATIAEQTFAGMSNWDPMAVVDGMIYLSTADGRLICVGE